MREQIKEFKAKHRESGLDMLNEFMDREEYGEADCGA